MSFNEFDSYKTHRIPVVESDIFQDNKALRARFAIGAVATGDSVACGRDREFEGVAQLRANVYMEKGFVTLDELDEKGTELDYDDRRSIHFAVYERTAVASLARVVANMRLIIKGDEQSPLPLEKFFPEVFEDSHAPCSSTEVSRLIAQHEDRHIQAILKWPLFAAGLKYVQQNNLGPVYGLLAPDLAQGLSDQGVPIDVIAEEKYIADINATKQPVEINLHQLQSVIDVTGDFGIDLQSRDISYLDLRSEYPLHDSDTDTGREGVA